MIRTIAYACANKRCRQSENDALEQKREKIRELHQQRQDSLKALQALESKLNKVTIDDGVKPQGLHLPPQVPTPGPAFGIAAHDASPSKTLGPHIQSNIVMTNLPIVDSDSSDSEAILSDDDEEHVSLEELVKAAQHVQKMLARIELLIKSSEVTQDSKHCRKRRVHKIYKRFCRRWESDISLGPVSPRQNRAFRHSNEAGPRLAPSRSISISPPRCFPQRDTPQSSSSSPPWVPSRPEFCDLSTPNPNTKTSIPSMIPLQHPIPVPSQDVYHQYPSPPSTGPTTLPYFVPSVTAASSMPDTNIRSDHDFAALDFGFDSGFQSNINQKTADNHSRYVGPFPSDTHSSTQNPKLEHRVCSSFGFAANISYPSFQYSAPSPAVPQSWTRSSDMLPTKSPRLSTSGSVSHSRGVKNDITTSDNSTEPKSQILWAGSRDILTSEAEAGLYPTSTYTTLKSASPFLHNSFECSPLNQNESNMPNDRFPYLPPVEWGKTVTPANPLPMQYNMSSQNMEWSRPMSSDLPMPTAETGSDSNYSAMETSTLEFSRSEFYDFGSSSLENPNQKSTRSLKPKPTQISQKWHSCSDPGCRQCFMHEDQWQQHIEISHQKDPVMPVRKFPGDLTTGGGTVSRYGSPESLGSAAHPVYRPGPGPSSKLVDFCYSSPSSSELARRIPRVAHTRRSPFLKTKRGRPRLRDDSAGEKEGNMQRKSIKGLSLSHNDNDNARTTNEDTPRPTPRPTPQETPNHLTSMHDSNPYVAQSTMREEVPQYNLKIPDAGVPKLSAQGNSSGADHLMSPLDVHRSPDHGPVPRIINSAPSEHLCSDSGSAPRPMAFSNGYDYVEPYSPGMEEPMDSVDMSYHRSDGAQRQRRFPDTMLPARKKGIKQPSPPTYVSTKRERPDSVEPESKRSKLSLPSNVHMEPLVMNDTMESKGSDRDIVDVLLEQWTIPVY
jgi:hypothetical protein